MNFFVGFNSVLAIASG